MAEHAVLVHLKLSDSEFGAPEERDAIHALCNELEAAIDSNAAGEYDGLPDREMSHQFMNSWCLNLKVRVWSPPSGRKSTSKNRHSSLMKPKSAM